jgi:hypothetical protein
MLAKALVVWHMIWEAQKVARASEKRQMSAFCGGRSPPTRAFGGFVAQLNQLISTGWQSISNYCAAITPHWGSSCGFVPQLWHMHSAWTPHDWIHTYRLSTFHCCSCETPLRFLPQALCRNVAHAWCINSTWWEPPLIIWHPSTKCAAAIKHHQGYFSKLCATMWLL